MTMPEAPVKQQVVVQAHHKGFPAHATGRTVTDLERTLSLPNGFTTPVLLLTESELRNNLHEMRKFCESCEFYLAPHVKTTMSPEIIALQFDYGAWAATVATYTQAAAVRSMGVDRILIANELVDPIGVEWLAAELDSDDDFAAFCFVDSPASIDALERVLAARKQHRLLPVLIEFGVWNGRAGARTSSEALKVADIVRKSQYLELAGVAGFEGVVNGQGLSGRFDAVLDYLRALKAVAGQVRERCDAGHSEFLVSVGGSGFMEFIRDEFDTDWRAGLDARVVLRSGCFVVHDSVGYERFRRAMPETSNPIRLHPALELWSRVLSRPEPNLAILDFGKRDVGIDSDMPVAQHLIRHGTSEVVSCPPATVNALNDQHAYLRLESPDSDSDLQGTVDVGDLVGFGISHPCTTFDKWRLIPMVDDHYTLVGAVQTRF